MIRNKAGRTLLLETKSDFYKALSQAIPGATWNLSDHQLGARTAHTLRSYSPSHLKNRLPDTTAAVSRIRAYNNLQGILTNTKHLQLQVRDWRTWSYTDGSCLSTLHTTHLLWHSCLWQVCGLFIMISGSQKKCEGFQNFAYEAAIMSPFKI